MPSWMRIARGMIGTGLAFAAVVGPLGGLIALSTVVFGRSSARDAIELTAQLTVAPFLLGVAFSAVLALTARGKSVDRISLPFAAAAGGGVGLLYFLLISTNGIGVWSLGDAIANFVLLTGIGSVGAAGTLLLAKRAKRGIASAAALQELPEGMPDRSAVHEQTAAPSARPSGLQ